MKSFLIAWLVAFGLVAVIATGVTWFVNSRVPAPAAEAARRQVSGQEAETQSSAPFTQSDAIEVIALRLPTDSSGDQARRQLQTASTITYHSYQHWRVCFDDACWVAHGPGRYAEPENDAALQREARTTPAR